MSLPPARGKLAAAFQWLGLPGIVLLAALLTDLVIIVPASVDRIGPLGSDLWLLPGIVAISACAVWARSQPVTATWAGSAALVLSTALLRATDANAYTALLSDISFAETVAGFELVYLCVRATRGGIAFVSVFGLVSATLLAVVGRGWSAYSGDELIQTLVGGFVLLALAVGVGVQLRKPAESQRHHTLPELLRGQWPLVGGLSLALFLEMFQAAASGLDGALVLACSAAAATVTVLAVRYPTRAALGLAALILLSALLMWVGNTDTSYSAFGGIPPTQVLSGMAVVVTLVRHQSPRRAGAHIGLLSVAVAIASLTNRPTESIEGLRMMVLAAVLLLGISVALGLYLKAREAERIKTVEAAVTDAQTAERMALARELHDVVAHHVTGIVVQAQAARMLGERDPRVVVDALGQIETAGTEALVAMRRLVRSMRGDAPAGSSEFSEQATTDLAADLRRLVEANNHGVPTEIDLDLPPDLPQEVARSALRLVQESLTNVGKHAEGATLATVSARAEGGELHIRVSDNGTARPGPPAGGAGGYGLIGMRERVELLRGRLSAGPGPDGGWLVEVWIPLDGEDGAAGE
ncbi:sensor histidine kinase [Prauserella muralis]|uniref:histidine kinase n=1 Tax=Prauserella muralis TaxID=588067 RepID=A0A2V4BC33_9PSEU|nr:histidine kinase [Prauserella muralis]PXY31609.1 two-component sensor histidine kinase [Prauserella muralis]TWE14028.1 signal transduction histidine kinase [Prauserella muralis]